MKEFSEKIEINLSRTILLFAGLIFILAYLLIEIFINTKDIFEYNGTLFHPIVAIPIIIFLTLYLLFRVWGILKNHPNYAVFINEELRILGQNPIFANEVDRSSIRIKGLGPGFVKFARRDGEIFRIPTIFCRQTSVEIYDMLILWITRADGRDDETR